MRHDLTLPAPPPPAERHDWQTVKTLFPYLWQWRGRMLLALICLVGAKLANVGVPLVFKEIIDGFTPAAGEALLIVPLGLLALYGVMRFGVALF
ncbi:MAG: metal ABC transporter permease, partial [Rhodocyclaceae bacterium]|nr:metal ABC transporter permease [Rhodocyclaceae bacterium]